MELFLVVSSITPLQPSHHTICKNKAKAKGVAAKKENKNGIIFPKCLNTDPDPGGDLNTDPPGFGYEILEKLLQFSAAPTHMHKSHHIPEHIAILVGCSFDQ